METIDKTKQFIHEYVDALCHRQAAVFVGAGMSCDCGYVDWKGLMKPFAEALGLGIEDMEDIDFPTLSQYYVNQNGTRGELNCKLQEMFSPDIRISISKNHSVLAALPVYDYWTTNYDDLIEHSLKKAGRKFCVKSCTDDFLYPIGHDSAVVYKMHGDKRTVKDIVLTRDDYENYGRNRRIFTYQLQCALLSKTFLFLGFSFKDANINFILGQLRGEIEISNKPKCYYFVKRETGHKRIIQELNINLLVKYGLHPIEIDHYSEITSILQDIARCYRRRTVMISGAACNYGKWGRVQAELFMQFLSFRLLKEGYSVVNRMGSLVGECVARGALKAMEYRSPEVGGSLPSHEIFPFPLDPDEYKNISSSNTGICLLLFGNKLEYDRVVTDKDWVEEVRKADGRKMKIIPVGATGYAAEEAWNEIIGDFSKYYPKSPDSLRYAFEGLSPSNLAGTDSSGTYHRKSDAYYQSHNDRIPGANLIENIIQIVKFLQIK